MDCFYSKLSMNELIEWEETKGHWGWNSAIIFRSVSLSWSFNKVVENFQINSSKVHFCICSSCTLRNKFFMPFSDAAIKYIWQTFALEKFCENCASENNYGKMCNKMSHVSIKLKWLFQTRPHSIIQRHRKEFFLENCWNSGKQTLCFLYGKNISGLGMFLLIFGLSKKNFAIISIFITDITLLFALQFLWLFFCSTFFFYYQVAWVIIRFFM